MRPLRTRLEVARDQADVPWEVIERDYLLSWILAGVAATDPLRDSLVFKGGTALKKSYFGDYRFSEDLDFSALEMAPRGDALESAIAEVCAAAEQLLDPYAPVDITCERYTETSPHPAGQEAFVIRARYPWQRAHRTRVLVEVTVDEPVLWNLERRRILHAYDEKLDWEVCVYALEEIVAEKLRAILQHAKQLEERGWARSRARDYYDLWRVLNEYRDSMDFTGFVDRLERKCTVRDVEFSTAADFFGDNVLENVRDTWDQWLGPLIKILPPYETVIGELRTRVRELIV